MALTHPVLVEPVLNPVDPVNKNGSLNQAVAGPLVDVLFSQTRSRHLFSDGVLGAKSIPHATEIGVIESRRVLNDMFGEMDATLEAKLNPDEDGPEANRLDPKLAASLTETRQLIVEVRQLVDDIYAGFFDDDGAEHGEDTFETSCTSDYTVEELCEAFHRIFQTFRVELTNHNLADMIEPIYQELMLAAYGNGYLLKAEFLKPKPKAVAAIHAALKTAADDAS